MKLIKYRNLKTKVYTFLTYCFYFKTQQNKEIEIFTKNKLIFLHIFIHSDHIFLNFTKLIYC